MLWAHWSLAGDGDTGRGTPQHVQLSAACAWDFVCVFVYACVCVEVVTLCLTSCVNAYFLSLSTLWSTNIEGYTVYSSFSSGGAVWGPVPAVPICATCYLCYLCVHTGYLF